MRLNDLLNAIPVLRHNIVHTAVQHTAIVDAILTGDPERARWAVAEHLDGTGALLRGFLAPPVRAARDGHGQDLGADRAAHDGPVLRTSAPPGQ